jgi:hypothetical protein
MKLLELTLASLVLASCSSGPKRVACDPHPQPIVSTHCTDPALELTELLARGDQLIGRTVTIVGSVGDTHPWCIDCCPRLGAVLALVQDTPFVQVSLHRWWCPRAADGTVECPLPRDGQRIAVRGRLDRVLHGKPGELELHDTVLCGAP